MLTRLAALLLMFASIVPPGRSQTTYTPPKSSTSSPEETADTPGSGHVGASESATFHDLVMDSFGPYPIAMALFTAGIHQATDNPPEWPQGMQGFSSRFGSNMGITLVGNTTRFGLGRLLGEDTSYHRCRCKGAFARLQHAAFSALIARRRSDGDSVFSVPGVAAPYAATMTAVYGWYPARYGVKDAFRMGNYNLLGTVGSNITFEFMPARVRKALGRLHLNNRRMAGSDD